MTTSPVLAVFRLYGGDTFTTDPILLTDSTGAPVNLTNRTATMLIWRDGDSPATPLATLGNAVGQSGLVIDPTGGTITATIAASDVDMPIDEDGEMWWCRIDLTNNNPIPPVVERVLQGYVVANP